MIPKPQKKKKTPTRMNGNVSFAKKTGFSVRHYLRIRIVRINARRSGMHIFTICGMNIIFIIPKGKNPFFNIFFRFAFSPSKVYHESEPGISEVMILILFEEAKT